MFQKLVVIDGRGHLLGRLASIVAKEVLNGEYWLPKEKRKKKKKKKKHSRKWN